MSKTTLLLLAGVIGASLSALSLAHSGMNASQAASAHKDHDAAHCQSDAKHGAHAMDHHKGMQHMRAMHQMHMEHHPEDKHEMKDMPHAHSASGVSEKTF